MQGDSGTGSVSTVSRDDNVALSSEGSSSTPGDCVVGFGLSLGVGSEAACSEVHRSSPKILTAEDLPDAFRSSPATSTLSRVNGIAGTKRTADSAPSNASRSSCQIYQEFIRELDGVFVSSSAFASDFYACRD